MLIPQELQLSRYFEVSCCFKKEKRSTAIHGSFAFLFMPSALKLPIGESGIV